MKLLNKIKILLSIVFFIVLIFTTKSFAATGTITEITVNLRKEPSTNSKKIMYVTQDDEVEVLEKVGDWYKIKFENITGYVFGKYIKVDDSKLTTNKKDEIAEEVNKENEEIIQIEEITIDIEKSFKIKSKSDIRLIPSILSNIIYTSKKDVSINVIEQINDWSYISIDGIYGWVRTDKIYEANSVEKDKIAEEKKEVDSKKEESVDTSKKTEIAYIKYDIVNLRKKASTTATVLAKLKLNDKVIVLEKINSVWSKVEIDGVIGYISTELLSSKEQEEKKTEQKEESSSTSRDGETTLREEKETNKKNENTTTKKEETINTNKRETTQKKEENKEISSSKVSGNDIVEYAKKYIGYKYVYGGASPSKGFDCSGFTYYVYKNFGYTLSRSSKAQANNGIKVEKENLQPGDLVIYKNASLTAIGHVGIYIGNNKMIHASEPGVGVTITDIDSVAHKYPQRYVTARRIIK